MVEQSVLKMYVDATSGENAKLSAKPVLQDHIQNGQGFLSAEFPNPGPGVPPIVHILDVSYFRFWSLH